MLRGTGLLPAVSDFLLPTRMAMKSRTVGIVFWAVVLGVVVNCGGVAFLYEAISSRARDERFPRGVVKKDDFVGEAKKKEPVRDAVPQEFIAFFRDLGPVLKAANGDALLAHFDLDRLVEGLEDEWNRQADVGQKLK